MQQEGRSKNSLLPFFIICAAVNGNTDAIHVVLKHYDRYITALATSYVKDSTGHTRAHLNQHLKLRLETKLIMGILDFRVDNFGLNQKTG